MSTVKQWPPAGVVSGSKSLPPTAAGGGGGGGVTSVGLSLPAEFTVTGSPVTTSGTLTATKATQTANTVYAGPVSGAAAAPAFRALVSADVAAAGGMVLLGRAVVGGTSTGIASTTSTVITFSSIPGTGTNLKLFFSGHDTSTSVANSVARLKVNSDPSNYSGTAYALGGGTVGTPGASGGSSAATTDGADATWCPGVNGEPLAMATGEIFIPGYAQTSFIKPMHSLSFQYASGAQYMGMRGWAYLLTSAITRLDLTCGANAFANGTTAELYQLP